MKKNTKAANSNANPTQSVVLTKKADKVHSVQFESIGNANPILTGVYLMRSCPFAGTAAKIRITITPES
jgi:hypothetical protein